MIIRESIKINAPMEKVWQTFIDLTRWTEWNTVMSDVVCDDKCLVNGKDIRCCFRPFLFPVKVNIRIHEVVPFNRVVWSAQKKGLFAFHEFFFGEVENGVIVTSKETFSGVLSSAGGFLLPEKRMRALTKTFLKDLKKASQGFSHR
jgi:hypothetical protein